jgi:lysine 6-dehydrogenase
MSRIEQPRHVRIRCGGLPQSPRAPLGHKLVFNVAGLTNEYTGEAVVIRGGKVVELPAFTEPEEIDFPMPVGRCQAFLTSGGTSTAPWTFEGKLETYDYKTVRYEGHFDRVRCLIDLGFLGTEPVMVSGQRVVPRELTHTLFEKALWFPDDLDLVVLRVECTGDGASGSYSPGAFSGYRIDLLDFQDPATGFTAMERTTAFPAAIVTYLQASGAIPAGAHPVETGVPAERFVSLLDRRGFKIVHSRL